MKWQALLLTLFVGAAVFVSGCVTGDVNEDTGEDGIEPFEGNVTDENISDENITDENLTEDEDII